MNRSHYPVLRTNLETIHLDASASFPLHDDVIAAVNNAMSVGGVPNKGQYDWSLEADRIVESTRRRVAKFLNVQPDEIYFCYSASDALHRFVESGAIDNASILHGSADHSSLPRALERLGRTSAIDDSLVYGAGSVYDVSAVSNTYDVVFANHVHHLLGSSNDIQALKQATSSASIVLDVSQSAGRMPVDLAALEVDAAYFSAQKVGGLTGCGVLYVSHIYRKHKGIKIDEPNTMPVAAIASLSAALSLIDTERPYYHLLHTTNMVRERLTLIEGLRLAYEASQYCRGVGIVSFSINKMSSIEFAQLLADRGVHVRAGDHCVTDAVMRRDLIRLSWHHYVSQEELRRALAIIEDVALNL